MAEETEARRVLVIGMFATGKSTVCRLVAEGLARSTVIEADIVRESIVGGFVEPDLSWPDAWVEQFRLQREIVNMWADRMIAADYHVVIDDAPIPPAPHFENDYAGLLANPTSVPVFLTASTEALRARLVARNGRFDGWFLEHLDELHAETEELLTAPMWSDWSIIDTSDLRPDEVAALILEEIRAPKGSVQQPHQQ